MAPWGESLLGWTRTVNGSVAVLRVTPSILHGSGYFLSNPTRIGAKLSCFSCPPSMGGKGIKGWIKIKEDPAWTMTEEGSLSLAF
jgi:hypothetical protein